MSPPHYTWKRGIRIGSARDGKVTAFIPDPSHKGLTYEMVDGKVVAKMADGGKPPGGTLAAEGVASIATATSTAPKSVRASCRDTSRSSEELRDKS